jgi:hypothetical protein
MKHNRTKQNRIELKNRVLPENNKIKVIFPTPGGDAHPPL